MINQIPVFSPFYSGQTFAPRQPAWSNSLPTLLEPLYGGETFTINANANITGVATTTQIGSFSVALSKTKTLAGNQSTSEISSFAPILHKTLPGVSATTIIGSHLSTVGLNLSTNTTMHIEGIVAEGNFIIDVWPDNIVVAEAIAEIQPINIQNITNLVSAEAISNTNTIVAEVNTIIVLNGQSIISENSPVETQSGNIINIDSLIAYSMINPPSIYVGYYKPLLGQQTIAQFSNANIGELYIKFIGVTAISAAMRRKGAIYITFWANPF